MLCEQRLGTSASGGELVACTRLNLKQPRIRKTVSRDLDIWPVPKTLIPFSAGFFTERETERGGVNAVSRSVLVRIGADQSTVRLENWRRSVYRSN